MKSRSLMEALAHVQAGNAENDPVQGGDGKDPGTKTGSTDDGQETHGQK